MVVSSRNSSLGPTRVISRAAAVFVVAEKDVGETEGVDVHCAGDGHAVALKTVAAQVLDGGVEAALDYFEGRHNYSGASVGVS